MITNLCQVIIIQSVRTSGIAVYEDVILAKAEVMHRVIYMYVAFTEPLVYKPISDLTEGKSIKIAFSEPRHYKAVIEDVLLTNQPHRNVTILSS